MALKINSIVASGGNINIKIFLQRFQSVNMSTFFGENARKSFDAETKSTPRRGPNILSHHFRAIRRIGWFHIYFYDHCFCETSQRIHKFSPPFFLSRHSKRLCLYMNGIDDALFVLARCSHSLVAPDVAHKCEMIICVFISPMISLLIRMSCATGEKVNTLNDKTEDSVWYLEYFPKRFTEPKSISSCEQQWTASNIYKI